MEVKSQPLLDRNPMRLSEAFLESVQEEERHRPSAKEAGPEYTPGAALWGSGGHPASVPTSRDDLTQVHSLSESGCCRKDRIK